MLKLKKSQIKKLKDKTRDIFSNKKKAILCESFENPANVGHIFRLAELTGTTVFLVGQTPTPDNKYVKITSQDTENRVNYKYFKTTSEAISEIINDGYCLVSIELTTNAKIYNKVKYPNNVCFILGNENDGVSEYALKSSREVVYIPMVGRGNSMNVAMSASVVLYNYIFGH